MTFLEKLFQIPWLVFLYKPFFFLLKFFRPVRKFEINTSEVLDNLSIAEDEWNLDKIKTEERIVITGSTKDDNFVFIQVLNYKTYREANIAIYQDGNIYVGNFHGSVKEEDNGKILRCGPLLLELRTPFRLWRVSLRGYLDDPIGEKQLVSLGGWWKALSDSQQYYSHAELGQFKDVIYKAGINFPSAMREIDRIRQSDHKNQLGVLQAELTIGTSKYQNKYRGFRERQPFDETFNTSLSVFLENGNAVHYNQRVIETGIFYKSDRQVLSVQLQNATSLDSENFIPFEFQPAHGLNFLIRKDQSIGGFEIEQSDGQKIEVSILKVEKANSWGLAFLTHFTSAQGETVQPLFESFPEYLASNSERSQLVLPFSNRACQDKSLTGGKGANLARLTSIANKFSVPTGLVVTTTAFESHISKYPKIISLVRRLDQFMAAEKQVEIGLELETFIKESEIGTELKEEILSKLPESEFYAVRSSAVGEDGADLSNAGQLESYLDVKKDEIFEKLKLCWTSNYRKEVLNYRRNYGQLLNPSMAVVIQEMSRNGVAGVMFTVDPVRKDPGKLIINALEGCGEQIVSGEKTPDEIHVDRVTDDVTAPENCCLSQADIEKLRDVGEYLENVFEGPQDVEFVVRDGKVYVVQSRNVTGLDNESHFELYTEFDTSELTEKEVLTNGNVGEVLSAPVTPFEAGSLVPMYDVAISRVFKHEFDTPAHLHYSESFALQHRKIFINCSDSMLRIWQQMKKNRMMDIIISGEQMFTDQMLEEAEERYGEQSPLFDIRRLSRMLYLVFYSSSKFLATARKVSEKSLKMLPNCEVTMKKLFDIFDKQLKLWGEALLCHAEISSYSSFTYVIVGMLIRGKEEGEFTKEEISDFAKVFSNHVSSDVISADVPSSLKKLANAIIEDGHETEFIDADIEESMDIIRQGNRSKPIFENFISTHGHRGPKELFIECETWAENTELLVLTVKSMISCPETEKKIVDVDVLIDSLNCKPTGVRRRLLKFFLSQTHQGVAYRESAKNCLVKATHATRLTLRKIGSKLYNEGYLPDEKLWLQLTIHELKELYETRSAKLVSRALRRRKISPEFEGLQFPLMSHGPVVPINFNTAELSLTTSLTLKGTTVCEGKVVARARVARNLEEAKETKPGEILITKFTDICWSPFFPIIKGIVTEIGGLLSHGAVVAREYGLPSLIAVQNATNYFKTGDLVELDTFKSTISRVEE